MNKRMFLRILIHFFYVCLFVDLNAQQGTVHSLTKADYERAEKFMGYNTEQLVDRAIVSPEWMPGERFWYRVLTAQGSEFVTVDMTKAKRAAAFDHARLAAALAGAGIGNYEATRLPFKKFNFTQDGKSISLEVGGKNLECNLVNYACRLDTSSGASTRLKPGRNMVVSPDGKQAAFIRDFNLWIIELATKQETRLTTDGIKDFGYATDNAGWRKSDKPVLLWSPDSKKIATFRQDQRNVSDMYLVTTNVGKPTLQAWKYPLPGDKEIAMVHRVVIDINQKKVIPLQVPPDPHRASLSDDISSGPTGWDDVEWKQDGSQLAFVSTSRDHKQEKFRIADASTGAVREVFEETVATQFESGQGSVNWRFLPASEEILWYSERDGWGHLYLYNVSTGKLKNQVTSGEWTISRVLKVDEKKRMIYFLAGGREQGRNPYFSHMYRVAFDGKNLALLTPENANHEVSLSPSGNFFVDRYSTQNIPPVTVLRTIDGKLVSTLEKADITRLTASGWQSPTPIIVKASDGQTDLFGLMYQPTNIDSNKKYPIINHIYPGPQGGSIASWSFSASNSDKQALAELGFIVVEIEGTCNPLRSKKFHDLCYGDISVNTLPDQVSGMQQLARKYPYIDISRTGIYGHSGGGFATAAAMFRYPDFFKVGISESGNHDNRNYEDDWGERYIGLLKPEADGKSNYEHQANQNYAGNLKGKLLLAHGLMDDNVPPSNTFLVVDALIKANKDFDLIVFPHSRHGYGEFSNYMARRRWDYFVRHLLNVNPPQEYEISYKADPRNAVE